MSILPVNYLVKRIYVCADGGADNVRRNAVARIKFAVVAEFDKRGTHCFSALGDRLYLEIVEFEVVSQYLFNGEEREIPSSVIGEKVMHYLKDLDQVAYVRFASIYREFKDVNTFMDELKKMLDK